MNYHALLIEIMTAGLGLLLLILALLVPREKKNAIGFVAAIGLAGIFTAGFFTGEGKGESFLNGLYISDALSFYFKQLFLAAALLVVLMSLRYAREKLRESRGEFYSIAVFALLGSMIMTSSNDLITLYVGLELMTISFVILSAFEKGNGKSTEAGIKYVLLSAISSAVLLYGMSLLYGLSGTVGFGGIAGFLRTGYHQPLAVLAGIMLLAGLGFKISAVPFHMWSPDIYEGAPTPITAFLAAVSKAAGFAVLARLFLQVAAPALNMLWAVVAALAVLSVVVGNLIAIPQANIKRLLAFSSISQAGYILLGLLAGTKAGLGAMLYYLLLYVFANTGAFAAVTAFSNGTGSEEISDFGGMWKRSPFLSATLMVGLLSMAGIPPAAGFIGKFYLFSETVRQGNIWLAMVAVAMSVVSVYYYIGVVRIMLSGQPSDASPLNIPVSLKLVMAVSTAATLFLGIYPGPATELVMKVAGTFIK